VCQGTNLQKNMWGSKISYLNKVNSNVTMSARGKHSGKTQPLSDKLIYLINAITIKMQPALTYINLLFVINYRYKGFGSKENMGKKQTKFTSAILFLHILNNKHVRNDNV
jgi:hypothetical protein